MSAHLNGRSGQEPRITVLESLDGPRLAEWDAYVERAASATFCHRAGWQRVVQAVWGHRQWSLCARRSGTLVGVLPLFHVRSPLFGSMMVSTPAAIYGGVLADDDETHDLLLATAKGLTRRAGADYLELRDSSAPSEPDRSHLKRKHLYVAFSQRLTPDEAGLFNTLPKKIRYEIRKGLQAGLQAELAGADRLDDFYGVYAENMRRLGTPVYPRALFARLLHEFPDSSDLFLVRRGARVAGATLNVYFRDTVLAYYGAARAEFYSMGVSTFMYWELMRQNAARGFQRFDFGRSKVGSGSWLFKRGWKMDERELPYGYYLLRGGLPNLSPANPRFKPLIAAWRRLPLPVTRLLGPAIVKHIP